MKICVVLMGLCFLAGGCSYFNQKLGLSDDNILEELIENKIEDTTGLDFDLTPESPER